MAKGNRKYRYINLPSKELSLAEAKQINLRGLSVIRNPSKQQLDKIKQEDRQNRREQHRALNFARFSKQGKKGR